VRDGGSLLAVLLVHGGPRRLLRQNPRGVSIGPSKPISDFNRVLNTHQRRQRRRGGPQQPHHLRPRTTPARVRLLPPTCELSFGGNNNASA
jgi:hypothetical protein